MTTVTTEEIIFSVRQQNILFNPTIKTVFFSAKGSVNNISFTPGAKKIIFSVVGGVGNASTVNADWNSTGGYSEIFNKPSTFPPTGHSHESNDIVGLPSALSRLSLDITQLETVVDNKVDESRVLTDVPTGAVFTDTDTLYDDTLIQDEIALIKEEVGGNAAHAESQHAPLSAEENVQSDWNAVSGDEQILNKPPHQLPVELTVSNVAPGSPSIGDLWIDTSTEPESVVMDTEATTFDGDTDVVWTGAPGAERDAVFDHDEAVFDGDSDVVFDDN